MLGHNAASSSPANAASASSPKPNSADQTALRGNSSARDLAGTIRASGSLLQEHSQKREAAEIPRTVRTARGRGGTQAIYSSAHAIAAANQAVQIRELTPSVLPRERYHAVQRRDRELVVSQNVVAAVLRPHADARREI